ncbi:MAG: chemotaxis protein CheB [Burkholderiaceae bacterium]
MATSNQPVSVKKIVASKAKQKTSVPPVVGIGASAGGLEALTQFLENVPLASGLAYVVVQHLDPTYKGMLPELLQRITSMAVFQVTDRMQLNPNCVYVIPPNKDLSLLHGRLHLLEPAAPRGLRLPIDSFLRSLAEDQREMSIGVILSGMGSDGTLGLRAIKEKAGLTLAQEPESAKFDAMPQNAINAGLVDIVAPAEQLPAKIVTYMRQIRPNNQQEPILERKSQTALEKIVILLRERTGNDFSLYKKNTVYRRIERRMGLHQIDAIGSYVRYLRENPQELDLLFKELLIGVTNFFRDPQVWDYLLKETFPAFFAANPSGKVMRAWVPACSTGEEAYSLAIIFKEALEQLSPKVRFTLQIFATDLDQDAINKARLGYFPANIAADISSDRMSRFFVSDDNGYLISKEIREMVVFAPQNIIMDPPFTKLDILTCRNLLIYLGPELQAKLIPLFHYALNRDGVLLLGSAETIGSFTNLFAPQDSKARLYRRIDNNLRATTIDFPTKFPLALPFTQEPRRIINPAASLQFQADQFLLQQFTPAAVLVNAEGDILYINGRTGKYLEPAAGKANWNIYAMAREGLRYQLTNALKKVVHQTGTIVVKNLQVEGNGSTAQNVNITVQLIEKPELLHGMVMIVFTEVTAPKAMVGPTDAPLDPLQQAELERAHEEIQIIREEMQTSQEELTATNEELQSTNEELQSTNEELTTSKEEMQSLNEELQTVNAELQSKVDDLSLLNNDMKNLLNSTDIATIFLDEVLNVRRFTTQATQIFKLIATDVGRPLSDIVTDLHYPKLQQDAHEVLRTLIFTDKQIVTGDGRWFKVRIMPYRTLENVIDGVVLTFTDISTAKQLEADLREKINAYKT